MNLRRILIVEAILLGALLIWNTFTGFFGSGIGSEAAFTSLLLLFVGIIVMGGTLLIKEIVVISQKKRATPLQKCLLVAALLTVLIFTTLHFLQ